MNRSHLWLRPLAMMSILAIVVGACAGGTVTAAPSAAPATSGASGAPAPSSSAVAANPCGTNPVTLNVWGGFPEMDAVYKKAGEAYKALHSNVDVSTFSAGGDLRGFEQKLTTALPSKTAGDIIVYGADWLSRFIDQNIFVPLPSDMEALVNSGAFQPALITDATYKGKLWGIPEWVGWAGLYYNTDMLAAAGFSGPPTSMDQIIAYATKLAKVDATGNVTVSGLSLRLSGQGSGVAQKFWIWLEQYGRSLIKEVSSGKWKADYNGPEGAKLLGMYVDMLKNKVDSPNIDSDSKAFEEGATAMFARESWVNTDILANAPALVGHYGSIALPGASIAETQSMFVPAASPNQACAWDFIKFLTDQDQQLSIPTISGWLPTRANLDLTAFLGANPGYAGFFKTPAGFTYVFNPKLPEFDELETKLADHLVTAYADYATLSGNPTKIQGLLDTWAAETNAILQANGNLAP
jgi:multiple sugar transport system substrate-binding protein